MPVAVDRFGRPVYPVTPFGFGAAMRAPNRPYGDDDGGDSDYGYGDAYAGQRTAQPLPNWSGAPPRPLNVGDGDAASPSWRGGGFTPIPMFPDVWAPWRKGAIESIAGLLHAMRPPSNMSGMGADTPECREEWAKAYAWCEDQLKKAKEGVRPERGVGYRNLGDCARGLVSAYCGGNNRADMPPEPPPMEPPPEPWDIDSDENDPDGCNKERNAARRQCAAEFASRKPNEAKTGGYLNIEDCMRGLVSEKCGGNPAPPPPPRRVIRYNIRPKRKR